MTEGAHVRRVSDRLLTPQSWRGTLSVAVVVVLLPLLTLWSPMRDAGAPGWLTLVAPLSLGVAVVLARVRAELGAFVLIVAVGTVVGDAFEVPIVEADLATLGVLAVYLGICWVACVLGSQAPVAPAWILMSALGAVLIWRTPEEVPLLVLAVGWFVVGAILRSRATVEARLRARVAELAAEQDRYAEEAVRLERLVIARELHDVVAHCMTVIVIQAQAGQQLAGRDPAAAADALSAISASVAEAERDVAALVELVDPGRPRPLTRALLDEMVRRSAATGTRVTLTVDGDLDVLEPALATAAHRVIQEGLTNAFRHAPGGEVTVDVRVDGTLSVTVANQPARGPAPMSASGTGQGLRGLRDRMAALGGTATWGTAADGRWRVDVVAPCERAELSPAGP